MFFFQWLKNLFTRVDVAPSKCDIQRSGSTTKPPYNQHDVSIKLTEKWSKPILGCYLANDASSYYTTDAHLARLDLAAPQSVEEVESMRDFCRDRGDLIFTIERKYVDGYDRYPLLPGDFQTPNAVGFVAVDPDEWKDLNPFSPSSVEDIHSRVSDFFESVVFEGMYGTAWGLYFDHELIHKYDTKEEAMDRAYLWYKTQARVID